jgi:single-strand DNA-binding protein
MSDTITVTGIVATDPRSIVTSTGVPISSFRLASGQRRYDRHTQAWVDTDTNWYTVSTFRQLADNVERSIKKGEHVVVTGRVRVRFWENAERSGTSVDIEAEALGHDLLWCTSAATRNAPRSEPVPRTDFDPALATDDTPADDETETSRTEDVFVSEFLPR